MSALAHAPCQLTRVRRGNSRSALRRPRNRTKYTYDNDGNAKTRNGYSVTWSSYNHPTLIAASGESLSLAYGPDRQRFAQTYTGSSGSETTTYFGGLTEKVTIGTNTDFRFYIYVAGRIVAIRDRTVTGTITDRYVLNDQQGSLSAIDTSTGTTYVAESFTPYGSRRNAATWSGPPTGADLTLMNGVTRQGYTGQTALGTMGLNHMNGRVQDSVTGRFLSADPYVSDPAFTQSFNRYSYVNNNPLTFTDPTGFAPSTLVKPIDPGGGDDDWECTPGPDGLCEVLLKGSKPRPPELAGLGDLVWGGVEDDINQLMDLLTHGTVFFHFHAPPSTPHQKPCPPGVHCYPPQETPRPCTEGPSTASGSVSGEFYAGPGGGGTIGVDDGHPFVTARVGFGAGGGLSYSPTGGLPITPASPNAGGTIRAVTGKGGFAFGIPGTPIAVSINVELGAAYDSNSGFGWVHNFDPEVGAAAESGFHADASVGGQVTAYGKSPTVYTGCGTCRAHY